LQWFEHHQVSQTVAYTALMIAPSYQFRYATGLITNFHQPQSTLLLLVAAGIGPVWRDLYQSALDNDYRFLSYGDSSLLWFNTDQA
jgi:S-adenosylmethionine:tRNA ribosyltransferase-isomerase